MTVKLPSTVRVRFGQNVSFSDISISYFFVPNSAFASSPQKTGTSKSAEQIFISCAHTLTSLKHSENGKYMQCPANCSGTPVPVIGGQNAQYGEESSICKSAIHSGVILDQIGGLVLIEPQRYPLNIRASFLALMSNSISSENAPAGSGFLIKNSIKSDPICISKPIEGETLKVTASSVLEKFVEYNFSI